MFTARGHDQHAGRSSPPPAGRRAGTGPGVRGPPPRWVARRMAGRFVAPAGAARWAAGRGWSDGGWPGGGWSRRGLVWQRPAGAPARLVTMPGRPATPGRVRAMTDRDALEALSSQELHHRAVRRAVRHLDIGFLWQLLREIPEGEAVAGHIDETAADETQLSAVLDDAFGHGPGRRGCTAPGLPGLPGEARRVTRAPSARRRGQPVQDEGRSGRGPGRRLQRRG